MKIGPLLIHRKWQDDLPDYPQPCLTVHWSWGGRSRRIAMLYIRGLGPKDPSPDECRIANLRAVAESQRKTAKKEAKP